MRIIVRTVDEQFPFEADGVSTDEHNNLEITAGQKPLGLFNKDHWESALYGEEVSDGEA